jgi:hypothetical protein
MSDTLTWIFTLLTMAVVARATTSTADALTKRFNEKRKSKQEDPCRPHRQERKGSLRI